MRLVSNRESVEQGEPSWLAVTETLGAVALYWGGALYWDTCLPLCLSVLAAPLLLLRSQASTKQGAMWFSAYLADKTRITPRSTPVRFWGILLPLVLGITVVCAYAMTQNFLLDHDGWSLFLRAMVVGVIAVWVVVAVAVAGAMAGSVMLALVIAFVLALALAVADVAALAIALAITVMVASLAAIVVTLALVGAVAGAGDLAMAVLLAGVPWITGIWLRSLGVRIVATLRHPLSGLRALPDNWRRILWVIDLKHAPELLPGPESLASAFSPQNIRGLIHARGVLKQFFGMLLFASFLLPALLYRWSIKSTVWFHWPLLYLLSGSGQHTPRHPTARISHVCQDRSEKERQWLTLFLLAIMVITTFSRDVQHVVQNHFSHSVARLYLGTFDLSLWAPWQWCSLTMLLMTFFLYLFLPKTFKDPEDQAHGKAALMLASWHAWGLLGLARIRSISAIALLCLMAGYTSLALYDFSPHPLPEELLFLTEIYTSYLP